MAPRGEMVANKIAKAWDVLRLVGTGGPGLCNIAVTNSCNAACDFCNFARGRVADLRWIDANQFGAALDILRRRGIRYVSFFGGEPLLHPRLEEMIAGAAERELVPAIITNGWLLPARLQRLADAGLKTVYVSLDAACVAAHEANRGLKGLVSRIRSATAQMPELGMIPIAQVAMSKLVKDYSALAPFLRDLGFAAVAFSYPQQARLGSSSLAWSDNSQLMKFSNYELLSAFEGVDELRKSFPVNNPRASVADMKRHLRGETEKFVCYGGYKSFYMDWNYEMWRCDAWSKPLCPVWEFAETPLVRDGCTACIADCYRDSSVMLHFAVSLGDAADRLGEGRLIAAFKALADRRNLTSLAAVAANFRVLDGIAGLG
ncbi:MAG TPA: radical SAM protein [Terriglobales bacterium]